LQKATHAERELRIEMVQESNLAIAELHKATDNAQENCKKKKSQNDALIEYLEKLIDKNETKNKDFEKTFLEMPDIMAENLNEQSLHIQSKDEKSAAKESKIEHLEKQNISKDKKIKKLEVEIKTKNTKIKKLKKKMNEMAARLRQEQTIAENPERGNSDFFFP
jgi:hypothetical protein